MGAASAADGLRVAVRRAEERETQDRLAYLPVWRPQPGPQTLVWSLDCDEILYGGAAGGGKSMIVAALPLQLLDAPRGRVLVLRRNKGDLAELIDLAKAVFLTGDETGKWAYRAAAPLGRFNENKNWLLANRDRLRIWYNHCDGVDDWQIYIGHAFDKICFDEVVQFEEVQYLEISSRLRGSVPGIRRQVIATTNPPKPDEPGNAWVRKRWAPWLDPKCTLPAWEIVDDTGRAVRGTGVPARIEGGARRPPAESGQVLYVGRIGKEEHFSTEPFSWWVVLDGKPVELHAQTRTYVRALLSDNQALLEGTPNYAATLAKNDPVRVRQLLHADWEASYDVGEMFRRTRFEPVVMLPEGHATHARAWDFAGTKPSDQNKDPDWTIGLKGCRHEDGYIYLTHVHRMRDEPGEVEAMRAHYAETDGAQVTQLYPRDPAEAGKTAALLRVSAAIDEGVPADSIPATKNVLSKAAAVSAAAHPRALGRSEGYGKIRVVGDGWDEFFDVLEKFPRGRHDDDVSALADLYNHLMSAPAWTSPVAPKTRPGMRIAPRSRGFG